MFTRWQDSTSVLDVVGMVVILVPVMACDGWNCGCNCWVLLLVVEKAVVSVSEGDEFDSHGGSQ